MYVGYIDEELIEIPNEDKYYGGPYWSCSGPILYTKQQELYLKCGSGDGGSATRSIIRANLEEKDFDLIFGCKYSRDEAKSEITGNWEQTYECKEF